MIKRLFTKPSVEEDALAALEEKWDALYTKAMKTWTFFSTHQQYEKLYTGTGHLVD